MLASIRYFKNFVELNFRKPRKLCALNIWRYTVIPVCKIQLLLFPHTCTVLMYTTHFLILNKHLMCIHVYMYTHHIHLVEGAISKGSQKMFTSNI